MQKRGQTSMEYLLLTAGVVLIAVVAGQYVVSSGATVGEKIETETNALVKIVDTTPPTTEILCNGGPCLTRYSSDVNISFFCQDNLGGVGCKETDYQINGGPWKSCSQPKGCTNVETLPVGGTYTIKYYSVDLNGNKEDVREIIIKVSSAYSAAGTCTFSWNPKWPKPGDPITVKVTSTKTIYNGMLYVDGTSTTCGTISTISPCSSPPYTPTTPGSYYVNVKAEGYDAPPPGGVYGTCGTDQIIVDGDAPTVTITAPDPCKWYKDDFSVSVTANDASPSSGPKEWKYTIKDLNPPDYTGGILSLSGSFPVTKIFDVNVGPGEYCETQGKSACEIKVSFTDRAGNTGSDTEKYSIDYTPPTITLEKPSEGWVNTDISFKITCTDNPSNGSGCKAIYWEFVSPTDPCPSSLSGYTHSITNPTVIDTCPQTYSLSFSTTASISCNSVCEFKLCYAAEDGAGNVTTGSSSAAVTNGLPSSGSYAIDKVNPSTSLTVSPENQWTNQTVTITVTASDGPNQSGIHYILFGFGGLDGTGDVYTSAPGVFSYSETYSTTPISRTGSCCSQQSGNICLNNKREFAASETITGTYTLSCADGAICKGAFGAGAEDYAGNSNVLCGDTGLSICYWQITDSTCNAPAKANFYIDRNIPSARDYYAAPYDMWLGLSSTLAVYTYAKDQVDGSGIKNATLRLYDQTFSTLIAQTTSNAPLSATSPPTGPAEYYFKISLSGNTWSGQCMKPSSPAKAKVIVEDQAGNQVEYIVKKFPFEESQDAEFWLDGVNPSGSLTLGASWIYSDADITVDWTASDTCSGLKKVELKIANTGDVFFQKTYTLNANNLGPSSDSGTVTVHPYDYVTVSPTGSTTVTIELCVTDQANNTYCTTKSFTMRGACDRSYAGDTTWYEHCWNIESDLTYCGDPDYGWTLDSCTDCTYDACYDSDTASGTKICTYTGYTGACLLDSYGSPYCETTTCDKSVGCLSDCITGELCCGGECYDPAAKGCCGEIVDGTVYSLSTEICCGGSIYTKGTGLCCNDTWYSNCTNTNCNGDACSSSIECGDDGTTCTIKYYSCKCDSDNSPCSCQFDHEESCDYEEYCE